MTGVSRLAKIIQRDLPLCRFWGSSCHPGQCLLSHLLVPPGRPWDVTAGGPNDLTTQLATLPELRRKYRSRHQILSCECRAIKDQPTGAYRPRHQGWRTSQPRDVPILVELSSVRGRQLKQASRAPGTGRSRSGAGMMQQGDQHHQQRPWNAATKDKVAEAAEACRTSGMRCISTCAAQRA